MKNCVKLIDYLRDAFLIDVAICYDIKGKKYISTPMKIYFVDPGLRNARLGFRQIEETYLMENIIYNELRRRGYSVDAGSHIKLKRDDMGVTTMGIREFLMKENSLEL